MTNGMTNKTTTDRVVEETKDVANQAQQKVDEVATTLKKQTREMADQASDQARSMAATRKEDVVYELEGVTDALRSVGDQLGDTEHGQLAKYSNKAADQIERIHDYLNGHDMGELIADAEDFGRRQPELLLGGALVAGLLIGRFFKSSASSNRSRQQNESMNWSSTQSANSYRVTTPQANMSASRDHAATARAASSTPYGKES